MHHEGHENQSDAREKLFELIKDIRIAMMTTIDDDGSLHSRPMYNHEADDQGRLWFFSRTGSTKTSEIGHESKVNLAYSHPTKQNYVSISGNAQIVRDKGRMEALWSEGLRVWFPQGTDDPDMCLICVTPIRGEYWDSPSSTVLHIYGYAKAWATGKSPYEMTEDEKVTL